MDRVDSLSGFEYLVNAEVGEIIPGLFCGTLTDFLSSVSVFLIAPSKSLVFDIVLFCWRLLEYTDFIFLFRYSYDEGETWHSYKFTEGNERFFVYGILTKPGEKRTTFTIYASYRRSHAWEILEIDMAPVEQKWVELNRTIFSHIFLKFLLDISQVSLRPNQKTLLMCYRQ